MPQIAIIFGSSTGRTEEVAYKIQEILGAGVVLNVANLTKQDVEPFKFLILGTSTWGSGDLQDDWSDKKALLAEIDFSQKQVAFFGLGDQEAFPETFVDGMGELYLLIQKGGAKIAGSWASDGYYFESSKALVKGQLVGLALDNDNQASSTPERIAQWTKELKKQWNWED